VSGLDRVLAPALWRPVWVLYFLLLSWQLLTPVTLVSVGSWDKLIHFGGFFVLAGLAILARWQPSTRILIALLLGYAALTEILQHFIPGRSFSVFDWLADALGIVLAVGMGSYGFARISMLSSSPR